ncbi:hypothetical protein D3C84_492440 [compost metagenome]
MFTEEEKYLLDKLLHKVKYSELDAYELNQFANSPITNTIIEKLTTPEKKERIKEFERNHPNVKKFCFKFDNEVGIAVQKRLSYLDESIFPVISNWSDLETENFALDILGPISFEKSELESLKKYIKSLTEK